MIYKTSFARGKELMDSGEAVLLDVRTPDEFEVEHAVGAKNLPLDDMEQAQEILGDQKKVLVYCRTGQRSGIAAQRLSKMGFTVYNLGGLNGWPYGLE